MMKGMTRENKTINRRLELSVVHAGWGLLESVVHGDRNGGG
jgi:hypothetical protein